MVAALSTFAQRIDSAIISNTNDTTGRWYSSKIIPKNKFRPVAFIAPAVLIGYGFAAVYDKGALNELDFSTKTELQEDHPLFAAHVDDYLQFAPAAAVYALNLSGIKGKHNLFDASMLYVTSAAIMGVSTHFVKQGVAECVQIYLEVIHSPPDIRLPLLWLQNSCIKNIRILTPG